MGEDTPGSLHVPSPGAPHLAAAAPVEVPQRRTPQPPESVVDAPPVASSPPSLSLIPSSSAVPTEPVPCPICLEELNPDDAFGARGCTHRACRDCTSNYWGHAIATEGASFPTCFAPGCKVVAATEDIAPLVGARLASRLTYLRALSPALSLRGERLWCTADGCWEPLPPPPPLRPPPNDGGGGGVAGAAEGRGGELGGVVEEIRVTCPRCATAACRRCGQAAHAGDCAVPLVSTASSAAYEGWALAGAAGACPYCGAHAVRDGGCATVQCGWCRRSYTFRPFQNVAALRGAVAVGAVAPPPVHDDHGEPIRTGIVSLVCGVGISTAPASLFLFNPGWEAYVVLVPWVLAGVWVFVDGLVSVRTGMRELREERRLRQRQQAAAGVQAGVAGAHVDGLARGGGGGGGVGGGIEAAVLVVGLVMVLCGVDWGVGAVLVRQYLQLRLEWGIGPELVTLFVRRGWGRRLNSLSTLMVGGLVFMVGVVVLVTGVWLVFDVFIAATAGWLRRRVGGGTAGGGGGAGVRGVGGPAGTPGTLVVAGTPETVAVGSAPAAGAGVPGN